MINLTETTDKCFAAVMGGCTILSVQSEDCGSVSCPFYKPKDCSDWIRRGKILIAPEDYFREREDEQQGKGETR